MAKYRLRAEHVHTSGAVLSPGTEVGDGTEWPWPEEPSNLMEGLDTEGKKKVDELHQRLYGHDAEWPSPIRDEAQARREAMSKPVSDQQARERGNPEPALIDDDVKPVVPRRR